MKRISVRAAGSALIPNIDALRAGSTRYIGRRLDREARAFVSTGEAESIPYHPEYRQALQCGDLLPGDEATARYCGVPWVPVEQKS